MTFLLFGADGQMGRELQRSLAPLGPVLALGRRGQGGFCGDLNDLSGIAATIRAVRPRLVVNAAAYTAVDRAESPAEAPTALRVNGEAPGVMAEAAASSGAWLVHYSTDYVFSGHGSAPWRESDPPAPASVYGQTKWVGEQAIAAATRHHIILRTSWVYGLEGRNFPRTLLRLAATRTTLDVVDDQVGAPTGADLVADITAHIAARLRGSRSGGSPGSHASDSPNAWGGVYHLAPRGETTWWALARFLVTRARKWGLPLLLDPAQIRPVPTEAFGAPAPRPANSRLATAKLEQHFGLQMPSWEAGVERWLRVVVESCRSVPPLAPPEPSTALSPPVPVTPKPG